MQLRELALLSNNCPAFQFRFLNNRGIPVPFRFLRDDFIASAVVTQALAKRDMQ